MRLPTFIARRYLFSKKSRNAINLITFISMIGIMVGTAALLIVLSIFNGLGHFIEGLFSALDPDVKIVAARGKTIPFSDSLLQAIQDHPEVLVVTPTIEGKVGMQYFERQAFAVLKGVDDNFTDQNPIDSAEYLYEGNYDLGERNGFPQGVFGSEVAARLGAKLSDDRHAIQVFVPQTGGRRRQIPISTEYLFPAGYFSVQKEYDEKYVLVSLQTAQEMFGYENAVTAYELGLTDIDKADQVKEELSKQLGADFELLTWYEQHQTLYQVMRNEKYISYLILTFMLILTAVNIIGGLSMTVLEKTKDIAVLKAMGADMGLIRKVFLWEGMLVGGIGVLAGMLFAFIFGLIQIRYGVLKLSGGESFRVQAYPFEMQLNDFVLIFVTVIILSLLSALYPAQKAAQVEVVAGMRR